MFTFDSEEADYLGNAGPENIPVEIRTFETELHLVNKVSAWNYL